MTIGIYALVFENTDKVYIGQSIHIEIRFKEHIYSFNNGHISEKLYSAFSTFGTPKLEILEVCNSTELDYLEEIYIKEFNSVENGFNIMHRPFSSFQGDRHPNSVLSNATIEKVFLYIVNNPKKRLVDISKEVNVSLAIIQNITALKAHAWLKEKYPIEYRVLESLKGNRIANSKSRHDYPTIIDPTGIEYNIENAKAFAVKHNLNRSHLVGVLNGKRKSHKKWKLKENKS